MAPLLWHMNADFEAELAAWPETYRRVPTIARRNRRLAPVLMWLAGRGDALLLEPPWTDDERFEATRRGLTLVDPAEPPDCSGFELAPWGWSPSAVRAGEAVGARVEPVPIETVVWVNSKVFSHELERELGVAVAGADIARSRDELDALVTRACPGDADKWVVKAPFGFAARERVLGRGPRLDAPSALWANRRLARGEWLVFEPWLDVRRELGAQLRVVEDGAVTITGISRMLTNGAGVTTGFVLGETVEPDVVETLVATARVVG
jgi:hypothetical protein